MDGAEVGDGAELVDEPGAAPSFGVFRHATGPKRTTASRSGGTRILGSVLDIPCPYGDEMVAVGSGSTRREVI
ncbi:hypothetical protein [Actinomadura rupiterrae]|uniref:hypothetical protein n=1 Tax=Actinomadura rupiterrae TaxID=559627 RepID=UPI0020A4698E|nr:hypothetical protein [Actinomadura rupiterrae]MCP2337836.1 hypothetical protein [Actinomadura rupiterrae]